MDYLEKGIEHVFLCSTLLKDDSALLHDGMCFDLNTIWGGLNGSPLSAFNPLSLKTPRFNSSPTIIASMNGSLSWDTLQLTLPLSFPV